MKWPAQIVTWNYVNVGDVILHNDELCTVTALKWEDGGPDVPKGTRFVWVTYKHPRDKERTFMAASNWLVAVVVDSKPVKEMT